MTGLEVMDMREQRRRIYYRQASRCEHCNTPLGSEMDPWHIAHRIPQRYIDLYGPAIIHHDLNITTACCQKCNDAVSISNHPVQIANLVGAIEADLSRRFPRRGSDETQRNDT